MKILIPTYLERSQVADLIATIEAHSPGCEVFASCTKASASVNRNLCLDQIAVGETAIMLDDDISGFFPDWTDKLLTGLTLPNAVMVSARLLNTDGTFGPTCAENYDPEPMEIVLPVRKQCVMPTAAIAFIHRGHRFPDGSDGRVAMLGSGFEDNWWIAEYLDADPSAVMVQSNRCRLTHANMMREQKGPNWKHNRSCFWARWPSGIPGNNGRR